MFIFQSLKQQYRSQAQVSAEQKTLDYLENTYFPKFISDYCKNSPNPTLFTLNEVIGALKIDDFNSYVNSDKNLSKVDKEIIKEQADRKTAAGQTTLFIRCRESLDVLVRYARMRANGSKVPAYDDVAVKEMCDFFDKLGGGIYKVPNPESCGTSISTLLTIGRTYGGADLKKDASEEGYNSQGDANQLEILRKCKKVFEDLGIDPGKTIGSGAKLSLYTPVPKPTESQVLGPAGPTINEKEEYENIPWVLSSDFLYPHSWMTNRPYAKKFVAAPQPVTANALRSILNDIVDFGHTNGLDDASILKACFGYRENGKIVNLVVGINGGYPVFDQDAVERMAEKIESMGGLNFNPDVAESAIKKYLGITTRPGKDVMNFGLAASSMKLGNELVLREFLKAIVKEGAAGGREKNGIFAWKDKDFQIHLKKSLHSRVLDVSVSGKPASTIEEEINSQLKERAQFHIEWSEPTASGRTNSQVVEKLISDKDPKQLLELKDSCNNIVLARFDPNAGKIELLKSAKFKALSIATLGESADFSGSTLPLTPEIEPKLINMDFNVAYYSYNRPGGRNAPTFDPAEDPEFAGDDNTFIRNLMAMPLVRVVRVSEDEAREFVKAERSSRFSDINDTRSGPLAVWLQSRLFCVAKGTTEHPIPDDQEQIKLRDQLNKFITNRSQPYLDLDFGDDLKYHITRDNAKNEVEVQNISKDFDKYANDILNPSGSFDYLGWLAARKDKNGIELKSHPIFFGLNNTGTRVTCIGADAPTRMRLAANQPEYNVNLGETATVGFSVTNDYVMDPTKKRLADPKRKSTNQDVTIYADIYGPYMTQQSGTIPSILQFTQKGDVMNLVVDTNKLGETKYLKVTYSDLGPSKVQPDVLTMPPSKDNKMVEVAFSFDAAREEKRRYLVVASGVVTPLADPLGSVSIGNTLYNELSFENLTGNPSSWLNVNMSKTKSYILRMLEGPGIDFSASGAVSQILFKQKQDVALSKKDMTTKNLFDENREVYRGDAPVLDCTSMLMLPNEKSQRAEYEKFKASFALKKGPALSFEQWQGLLKNGRLDVAGNIPAEDFHIWLVNCPNSTYKVAFCGTEFFNTLRNYVRDDYLDQSKGYDMTAALMKTLNISTKLAEVSEENLMQLAETLLFRLQRDGAVSQAVTKPYELVVDPICIKLVFDANKLVIRPGRKIEYLRAYDPGVYDSATGKYVKGTDSGSTGYSTIDGSLIGVDKLYPFRFLDANDPAKIAVIDTDGKSGPDIWKEINAEIKKLGNAAVYAQADPIKNAGKLEEVAKSQLGTLVELNVDDGFRLFLRRDKIGSIKVLSELTDEIPMSYVPMDYGVLGERIPSKELDGKNGTYTIRRHVFKLQANDGAASVLSFGNAPGITVMDNGASFSFSTDAPEREFSVPLMMTLPDGSSTMVGRARYTYDRSQSSVDDKCQFSGFERNKDFVQVLLEKGLSNYLQPSINDEQGQPGHRDENGKFVPFELVMDGRIGDHYLIFGDADKRDINRIASGLQPYLDVLNPWQVVVDGNEYDLSVRKDKTFNSASKDARRYILSYKPGRRQVDLYQVEQNGTNYTPMPARPEPSGPQTPESFKKDFDEFLKQIMEGTFKTTSSLIDDGFLFQIPTRTQPQRWPYA